MKLKKISFTVVSVFLYTILSAQCPQVLLSMQLDPTVSDARKANFLKRDPNSGWTESKFRILEDMSPNHNHPKGVPPYNIEKNNPTNFFNLLKTKIFPRGNGVRIVLGAYLEIPGADNANAYVTADNRNWLVPIFVPTKTNSVNNTEADIAGEYYTMTPDGKSFYKLSGPAYNTWVGNYRGNILDKLWNAIGYNNDYGETKSLWYDEKDFSDLVTAIECQQDHLQVGQAPITQFTIQFGAFDFERRKVHFNRRGTKDLNVSNQLTLIFEVPNAMVQTQQDKYALQYQKLQSATDSKQSNNRASAISKNNSTRLTTQEKIKLLEAAFYDTGVPCPPDDHCFGDNGGNGIAAPRANPK